MRIIERPFLYAARRLLKKKNCPLGMESHHYLFYLINYLI